MREVPMDKNHMSINLDKVMDYVDEYTIGIVGIMGITYTGRYDDIKALDKLVEEHNKRTDYKVYIHVDAASGGLYAPFVEPHLKWDFRLKMSFPSIHQVISTVSFILVGWVLWRDKKYLPEELILK